MYKISELIGKQSITLLDAGCRGVVAGAYFDRTLTKCKCFLLLSDDDENRYFVDYKNLSSISEDAMVIKSAGDITEQPASDIVPSPINLPAFNQDGKSLGIIRDIVMDGAAVVSFLTDSGEIAAGTMLSRSEIIVVFNDTGKPLKIKRPVSGKTGNTQNGGSTGDLSGAIGGNQSLKEKLKKPKEFSIEKEEEEKPNRVETPSKISPVPSAINPNISLNKYYFLLGKRLLRSIYTEKGTLIARENDLITENIIQNAKEGGKLVAIALHSL